VNLGGEIRGMGSPPLVARHRCERDYSAIGKYTAVTAQGLYLHLVVAAMVERGPWENDNHRRSFVLFRVNKRSEHIIIIIIL